jgi:hypothetical protein
MKLELGQRWHWRYSSNSITIAEIEGIGETSALVRCVSIIKGDGSFDKINNTYSVDFIRFDSVELTYLPGQDKPVTERSAI